jgi:hypothetical protein
LQTDLDLEELKKKVLEEANQPPRHLLAFKRIRKAIEPCAEYMSDETIYHILLVCGGDTYRALHKCILALQAEAFKNRNIALKMVSRELLKSHEAGMLLK